MGEGERGGGGGETGRAASSESVLNQISKFMHLYHNHSHVLMVTFKAYMKLRGGIKKF